MSRKEHKGEKKNADLSKAALDHVMDKVEKHAALINQAEKAASAQAVLEVAVALNQNYIDIAQVIDPLIPAIESYQNIADSLISADDTQVYSVSESKGMACRIFQPEILKKLNLLVLSDVQASFIQI